jgi:hypothetical protein
LRSAGSRATAFQLNEPHIDNPGRIDRAQDVSFLANEILRIRDLRALVYVE